MGKSDIESWIASTSTSSPTVDSENPEGSASNGWRRELVLSDWQAAMDAARRKLLTSSTKIRIRFLQEELLYIAQHCGMCRASFYSIKLNLPWWPLDLSLEENLEVFKLLTLTYSRYVDAPSREAVEAVGVELVRRDELRGTSEGEPEAKRLGIAEQIIGWLWSEADRMSKRPRCVSLYFHTFSGAELRYIL